MLSEFKEINSTSTGALFGVKSAQTASGTGTLKVARLCSGRIDDGAFDCICCPESGLTLKLIDNPVRAD